MSLTKQMILFISALLLIVLVGTFTLTFTNTKAYLEDQLQTHAQDTATSLGLSLSSVANPEEASSMQTMIDAVFDRGYFAHISMKDMDNAEIYLREAPLNVNNTPDWFVKMVSFHAPLAEALVQSGWQPIGTLRVQSNLGYAYTELWKTASSLLVWFSLAAIFSIMVALISIKTMLKPMTQLMRQAESIVKKEYLIQDKLPKTIEIRNVVIAMNSMVKKIKETFDRDAEIAKQLQVLAYQDAVTETSNRVHFEMLFDSLLDPHQENTNGALVLIRVEGLKALNDTHGYLIGNMMIKNLSDRLQSTFLNPKGIYARLNGTELIAVLPELSAKNLAAQAASLAQEFPHILDQISGQTPGVFISIALIDYQPGEHRSALLVQLDFAIKQALLKGYNQAYYHQVNTSDTTNTDSIESWLSQAIAKDRFTLFKQPSVNSAGAIHDYELLIRLKEEDGTLRSAGYFIPVLEKLNQLFDLDVCVIEKALAFIKANTPKEALAINLSRASLSSQETLDKIINLLQEDTAHCLSFELSETLVISLKEQAIELIDTLKTKGIPMGIDQFGGHFSDMHYLQQLRPNYVKLNGAFTKMITQDKQTQSYVSSLCEMAMSLDIQVIAMAIENEAQVNAFKELGVSYFQGYHFGAPIALQAD